MSKLQEKPPVLKREYGAHQNMKFLICVVCSIFVGTFCPPGFGSTDLIESGFGSETLLVRS